MNPPDQPTPHAGTPEWPKPFAGTPTPDLAPTPNGLKILTPPETMLVISPSGTTEPILVLDRNGMTYKGKLIEDAGEAHAAFIAAMKATDAAELARLRAQLAAIEEDGTEEHNAAVGLRQKLVAALDRAEKAEAALAAMKGTP